MPMKEITVPEQLVQNLQRLGYWRLCRREEGVFAVDAQRHALLESLQTLKHPTATEQALIDEITKAEADALANHNKREDDAHKAICDLYEKTRLCVKDMLLGKYLRISLNDGYRRYLHVRGVKMYSLHAKVCIFGSEIKINNLVGSIEYHEGTEFELFRSDDVIKQTTCLNIEDALRDWLHRPETATTVRDELAGFVASVRDWMASPEGSARIGGFAGGIRSKFKEYLRDYLKTNLAPAASRILGSDTTWSWVSSAIPAMRPGIERMIREIGTKSIIEKLNVEGRVKAAVDGMDMAEFHGMLNQIIAEHLGAIQVLGYLLGAIVGIILVFE